MSFADEIKLLYKSEIDKAKCIVGWLSISFDELASTKNRRYILDTGAQDLGMHSNDAFWKLGLIRIEGKTNYMLSTRDISTRLDSVGLTLDDIVAMMIDGGSEAREAISEVTDLVQQRYLAAKLWPTAFNLLSTDS